MADLINVGLVPNDRSGDDIRTAFIKLNGFVAESSSTLQAIEVGKLDATVAALLVILDNLPALPSDPSMYPPSGGLFRDSDANGYRIVRLYPTQQ